MSLLKHATVKRMMEIVLSDIDDARIAERSAYVMSDEIDRFVTEVIKQAWSLANHRKSITIKPDDIMIAMEIVRRGR